VSEEEEGFLDRWSRRKKEAARDPESPEAGKVQQQAASEDKEGGADPIEEEFDISKLPPVESITAGTDIRAFLSKGVPAALTQAALRRAWSADPAIRDYIGLSEYSWDFNSPGIDGFGPLDPTLNVQEMVADVFGKVKQAAAETEALADKVDSLTTQTPAAETPAEPPKSVELRGDKNDPHSKQENISAHSHPEAGDKTAQSAAAPQQPDSEIGELPVQPRRHGSALPN
jgi:hypothetical protein